MRTPKEQRRTFLKSLLTGLGVVWPIVSLIAGAIIGLGLTVGWIEGWSPSEAIYFSFVTGLTIGFGDFVPKSLMGRVLTLLIGFCGVLLTALVAAVAVKALSTTFNSSEK